METTFISIHDLTPEARILYSSDSIVDVLGYTPDEIVNQSAWHFFALEEAVRARQFHRGRIEADKAAVLVYCRLQNKEGDYIGCEVCFTVVYDVMVVCTSIYRQNLASEKRALAAPLVRRTFSSSPQDPRYHMLSHLSDKFNMPAKPTRHEPRAALFLNRFTRTLSIMYATTSIEEIIGISAENMRGRSFYYCIAENCLPDSVKCLESAKANDSIAYLRFWFRDPRQDDQSVPEHADSDEEMTTGASADMDGEIHVVGGSDHPRSSRSVDSNTVLSPDGMEVDGDAASNSRTSSGDSGQCRDTHEAIFGQSRTPHSSTSSLTPGHEHPAFPPWRSEPIELEAVISCTSDGLVVCLRKARPSVPTVTSRPSKSKNRAGTYAAPWALEPMLPTMEARGTTAPGPVFAPALGPQGACQSGIAARQVGPDPNTFMRAIREQAIFAWALIGINGSLTSYSKGEACGEALPKDGLPIWASDGTDLPQDRPGPRFFGDPGLDRERQKSGGSRSASSGIGSGIGQPPPS